MDWAGKLIGLSEFKVVSINTRYTSKVIIDAETKINKLKCPRCGEFTYKIDHRYMHCVRDNSISGKKAYLAIHKKVFYCRPCKYSFFEPLESVHPGHIYAKRYEITVFERCLENTIANVSRSEQLPYDCVRGIYKRIADICVEHLTHMSEEVEILGIDEVAIRKGHKDYQAVISNIT